MTSVARSLMPAFPHVSRRRCPPSTCLRLGLLAALACQAPAALAEPSLTDITWGSATTISGDSDVDTIGTLVYAYNFGSTTSATTTTVNGVTFQPFVVVSGNSTQTVGDVTVTETSTVLASDRDVGSGSAPFSGLSAGYQALLSSEVYADNSGDIRVDLGGLTPGNAYRLQWWTNDSALTHLTSLISPRLFDYVMASGSATSVTLDANTSEVVGGLGQYAIGTFTATGTTATFQLVGTGTVGNAWPMMNALQLRSTSAPVPEIDPAGLGSVAALVTGALGLLERRRMKAMAA